MSNKKLKPTRDNRSEAVAALWKERHSPQREFEAEIKESISDVEGYILAGKVGPAISATMRTTYSMSSLGVDQGWNQNARYSENLRRCFAIVYWATELDIRFRQGKALDFDFRYEDLLDTLRYFDLAAACNAREYIDWFSPYLFNLFRGGAVDENLVMMVDRPYRLFVDLILTTILRKRWPARVDVASLGAFAGIVSTIGDSVRFREALIEFCDFRIAQAFGYDGIDATKRRPPSRTGSVMDKQRWDTVFPVELFTLKYAYEQATGKTLSLDADHPLLQTPLMKSPFPKLYPLYEDDFTKKLQAFGRASFGEGWQPRTPNKLAFPLD